MARSSSWLHFWKASTPPESVASSRNNSAHGGNVFGNVSDDAKPMQRSNSFMWNWSKYRADDPVSSPASPGSSSHGANQFSADANGDQVPCEIKPAITPPRAMMRNLSMGSFSTLHRPTPPTHAPKPVAIPRLSAERRRAQARAAIDQCIDLSRPGFSDDHAVLSSRRSFTVSQCGIGAYSVKLPRPLRATPRMAGMHSLLPTRVRQRLST